MLCKELQKFLAMDTETCINDDIQHLLTHPQELKSLLPKTSRFYFHAGRQKGEDQDNKTGKRGTKKCQQRTSNLAGVGGKQ